MNAELRSLNERIRTGTTTKADSSPYTVTQEEADRQARLEEMFSSMSPGEKMMAATGGPLGMAAALFKHVLVEGGVAPSKVDAEVNDVLSQTVPLVGNKQGQQRQK